MFFIDCRRWLQAGTAASGLLFMLYMSQCTADYPATGVTPTVSSDSTSTCTCSPPTSTTVSPSAPVGGTIAPIIDTIRLKAPHILPDGGSFHVSVDIKLTTDTLPAGAVIEYSLDKGKTWQVGQQFTLICSGQLLARLRLGQRVSSSQAASFRLYFERMLVIGNSITSSPPLPGIGWYNSNGMAASAPEKDFVHLLTTNLETLHKPLQVKLLDGGDFEQKFGAADYRMLEFTPVIRDFKPDLIIVRIGENMDENRVQPNNLESQFRILLESLSSGNQPIKIVCTTSVWNRPKADAVIRKVTAEKGYSLVELSSMVGQGQYYASQYAHPGVAAHPNDAGMQRIADLIWIKIQ